MNIQFKFKHKTDALELEEAVYVMQYYLNTDDFDIVRALILLDKASMGCTESREKLSKFNLEVLA